jgi:hypothetical protein
MKTKSIKDRAVDVLKRVDVYGHPISLTYKKNATYTSGIGGFMTILSRVIILIYFGIQVKSIRDDTYIINNSYYLRNLATDFTEYHLDKTQFDFAILA